MHARWDDPAGAGGARATGSVGTAHPGSAGSTGPGRARTPRRTGADAWLRRLRMRSLLLDAGGAGGRDPGGVVRWFGALQAQDLGSVLWSLGIRTGEARAVVERAVDSGEVLRTWPMRGTLHLVPGRDARWMVTHLGGRSIGQAASRRATLGLDLEQADRATEVLAAALEGGRLLTRSECLSALASAGITTSGQRGYHLLWYASAQAVTCVGPSRGGQQTFALLDEWAPGQVRLDRAEALATIAHRFVRSHGPVTVHDLARWARLTVADARAGLRDAEGIAVHRHGDTELHMSEEQLDDPGDRRELPGRALPGFDELVLGYRDRSAQLEPPLEPKVVPGGNGMFANTLVLDGRVRGTWRRRARTRTVQITAVPFERATRRERSLLEQSLHQYAAHLCLEPEITWSDPP